MEFKDKYTTASLGEKDKIVLSQDYYALCEVITDLIMEMRKK